MERINNARIITPNDSVAVVVETLNDGDLAVYKANGEEKETRVVQQIPIYHKFAVVNIKKGEEVFKYGESIGRANQDIQVGEHVHTHNITSIREQIQHEA